MCGVERVAVFRAPRVAVMSTGDEIVEPFAAGAMRPGQVRMERVARATVIRELRRVMVAMMTAKVDWALMSQRRMPVGV